MGEASKVVTFIANVISGPFQSIVNFIFFIFSFGGNTTTWHPATNYGLENTWYKLLFNDKINFKGDYSILQLGASPQNMCDSIGPNYYGDPTEGRSVKLYDEFHPDSPLPEGMKVYLYWGKKCSDWRPYGVITVPPNTNRVEVPRLNKPSPNYEVFNNFHQRDGGERVLNGHVRAIRWSIP